MLEYFFMKSVDTFPPRADNVRLDRGPLMMEATRHQHDSTQRLVHHDHSLKLGIDESYFLKGWFQSTFSGGTAKRILSVPQTVVPHDCSEFFSGPLMSEECHGIFARTGRIGEFRVVPTRFQDKYYLPYRSDVSRNIPSRLVSIVFIWTG